MSTAEFPTPVRINGRLYFHRQALENYKRALLGLSPLADGPHAKVEIVPAAEAAAEFGVGRRTLGRRIANRRGDVALGIDPGAHGDGAVLDVDVALTKETAAA